MTTVDTITPPDEMDQLLDSGDRRCEGIIPGGDKPCPNPAVWAITLQGPCSCDGGQRKLYLSCDPCYQATRNGGADCTICRSLLVVVHVEPIR